MVLRCLACTVFGHLGLFALAPSPQCNFGFKPSAGLKRCCFERASLNPKPYKP